MEFVKIGYPDGQGNFKETFVKASKIFTSDGTNLEDYLTRYQTSANVTAYADMLSLTEKQAPVNSFIFVMDASADNTVGSGWAIYRRVAKNGNAADFFKIQEGESLDINFPALEQAVTEAQTAAQAAQSTANSAVSAAAAADTKAGAAQTAAAAAQTTANNAQTKANNAPDEAALLDAAYCTSIEDMRSKNLRPGAFVLMADD